MSIPGQTDTIKDELTLPSGDRFSFYVRHLADTTETEMVLRWLRPGLPGLDYLVGWGHAGYPQVRIFARDDLFAVWVSAVIDPNEKWRIIASLELTSGEFHNEGDFLFPGRDTTWAFINRKQGFLVEKQLTLVKEDISGLEKLFDPQHGLVWVRDAGDLRWSIKSGSMPSTDYPCPDGPYEMTAPAWLEDIR